MLILFPPIGVFIESETSRMKEEIFGDSLFFFFNAVKGGVLALLMPANLLRCSGLRAHRGSARVFLAPQTNIHSAFESHECSTICVKFC